MQQSVVYCGDFVLQTSIDRCDMKTGKIGTQKICLPPNENNTTTRQQVLARPWPNGPIEHSRRVANTPGARAAGANDRARTGLADDYDMTCRRPCTAPIHYSSAEISQLVVVTKSNVIVAHVAHRFHCTCKYQLSQMGPRDALPQGIVLQTEPRGRSV